MSEPSRRNANEPDEVDGLEAATPVTSVAWDRAPLPREPATRAPHETLLARHVVTRAFRSFRDAPGLNLLAVAIIAAVLLVQCAFLALAVHVARVADGLIAGDEVNVYLAVDLAEPDIVALRATVRTLDGVAAVEAIPPDRALEILAEDMPDWREWLDELARNPLPTTLVVHLTNPESPSVSTLVDAIASLEGVDEVQAPGAYAQGIARFAARVHAGTAALAGLLILTVLFIATAVMRLALAARESEIEIMRFLGATDRAIRAPFLFEGATMGALAGAIAAGAAFAAARSLGPIELPALLAGPRAAGALTLVPTGAWLATLTAGPLLGLAGAWLAVRAGLRPETTGA